MKEITRYIVTSRCGVLIDNPSVYATKEEALVDCRNHILEALYNDEVAVATMKEEGFSEVDPVKVVEWGVEQGIINATDSSLEYTEGSDWVEAQIHEVKIPIDEQELL